MNPTMSAHLAKGLQTSPSADLQFEPNHVPRPNSSSSSKSVADYPLHIEGSARLYTCNLPMDTFVDFSNPKDHQSYTYCWINGDSGAGGHISFPTPGTCGEFKIDLKAKQGDPDLLKTQVSMHFRDEHTNNFRTSTLAVSVVDLNKLLEGGEDRVIMYDQFVQGNFCDLSFRLTNASDYANYKGAAGVGKAASTRSKPLLQLKPSALRGLKDINEQVNTVSQHFVDAMGQNNVAMAKGGEPFYRGVTRFVPQPLLFFSLMLGTPAYALFPLQSGVRWEERSPDQCRAHSSSSVSLCHHERSGGVPGSIHSPGSGTLPYMPHDTSHRVDCRGGTEAGRHTLWSVFCSSASYYSRRWIGPISARRGP
jgi:hypothetical protein